jgi:hypothetical protein
MARTAIPHTVFNRSTGAAVAGAAVEVRKRSDNSLATIYTSESGGTVGANPLATDANGKVAGWLDRGAYVVNFSGGGITAFSEQWDSSPGSDGAFGLAYMDVQTSQALGLATPVNKGRGKAIIATTEARTNTVFGYMPTPDLVSGLVVPSDALAYIAWTGEIMQSVAAAAGFQYVVNGSLVGSVQNDAALGGTGSFAPQAGTWTTINASPAGALQYSSYNGLSSTPNVFNPTGIILTPGTYDFGIQFKATSGSVSVRNRKFLVWTMAF